MLDALVNKMTPRMLWVIVIPTALLIFMLSCLIGAYTVVVWQADEVSYDGIAGKFTAKIHNLQRQVELALAFNEQLSASVTNITSSINSFKSTAYSAGQHSQSVITSDFDKMLQGIKMQSDLLTNQKAKLQILNHDLQDINEQIEKARANQAYSGKK